MATIDVLVIVALLIALVVGLRTGLVTGLFSLLGLASGVVACVFAVPALADAVGETPWRGWTLTGAAVLILLIGASVGGAVGASVRRRLDESPARWLDMLAGGVVGLAAGAAAVLVVASSLAAGGVPRLSTALTSSVVVQKIQDLTPDVALRGLSRLEAGVRDDALPAINGMLADVGLTRAEVPPPEPLDVSDPAVDVAADSVLRVNGPAYACGRGSTGSGFVAAPGRVVTNAHVVAGLDEVSLEARDGQVDSAQVVYFDEDADIAILSTDAQYAPLPLAEPVPAGTEAVVLGYPRGGPLMAVSAHVLAAGQTYMTRAGDEERPAALREVYRLATHVEPGNSGGPLLTTDGAVAGLIFAKDDSEEGVAYALTGPEVRDALAVVAALGADPAPVDVGECA